MYRTNFNALILALCFCGFSLSAPAEADQIDISDPAAAAAMLAKAKAALAAGGTAEADAAQKEDAKEDAESPEDALVAKLVEVKFERTPETILKAWSAKHQEKDGQEEKNEPKKNPVAEHGATVVSRFGEVLVLKVASVEDLAKDAKLKAEAAVTVGAKEDSQEINPFTVLTVLRDIKQRNGIDDKKAEELSQSINRVEAYYFGRAQQEITSEDLKTLAQRWVQQSN